MTLNPASVALPTASAVRYTRPVTANDEKELAYYRAVEDLFATLRGVPHVLSPKDFHLLRQWWRERVPISAVGAGITEVFARRRDRGETEPVVSLAYCRHAVKAQAKHVADMQVGAAENDRTEDIVDIPTALGCLAKELETVAAGLRTEKPQIAGIVDRFVTMVEKARELPAPVVEEHLFALESALLSTCLTALSDSRRSSIERRARTEAESTASAHDARERTFRALRDRLVREELGLPRLELNT